MHANIVSLIFILKNINLDATFCSIYAHSSTVHKPSYFSINLQAGCLVLIPGNSTGNPYMLLNKEYNMNTDHKNRRAQQTVPQNKHQLWEEPYSFVNTPHKICSDYLCFGLFMHLVPTISMDNLYSVVPTAHTNKSHQANITWFNVQ